MALALDPGTCACFGFGGSWFVLLFRQYPELVEHSIRYKVIDRIAMNTHHRTKPLWCFSC